MASCDARILLSVNSQTQTTEGFLSQQKGGQPASSNRADMPCTVQEHMRLSVKWTGFEINGSFPVGLSLLSYSLTPMMFWMNSLLISAKNHSCPEAREKAEKAGLSLGRVSQFWSWKWHTTVVTQTNRLINHSTVIMLPWRSIDTHQSEKSLNVTKTKISFKSSFVGAKQILNPVSTNADL